MKFILSKIRKTLLWATTREEDLTDQQRWRDIKGNYPYIVPPTKRKRIDLIYEDEKGIKRYEYDFKGCIIVMENEEISNIIFAS